MSKEVQLLKIFVQDLQQDATCYDSLLEILHALHRAILEHNTEIIEALNSQLVKQVSTLHEASLRRRKITDVFKLPHNDEGILHLIDRLPEAINKPLHETWIHLKKQVIECKRQNDINGKLMSMHHDLLNQLLTTDNDSHLYTPQYF